MADYTVRNIDDMYSTYLGGFKHARAELGVTAFGFQVVDMPPNLDSYPEHDHAEAGQEEVFIPLHGKGAIEIEGDSIPLEPGVMVRVGPTAKRKLVTHDHSMRVLVIGGTPGKPYEPAPGTEVGAPDPLARD